MGKVANSSVNEFLEKEAIPGCFELDFIANVEMPCFGGGTGPKLEDAVHVWM